MKTMKKNNSFAVTFAMAFALSLSATAATVTANNWAELSSALTGGNDVVLGADFTQAGDELALTDNRALVLDLNGHTLTAATGKRLFRLDASGCELTITNALAAATGKITRSDLFEGDGGVVYVNDGHLILAGGTFTGKANRGGFAFLGSTGRLTMNGGTCTDCVTSDGGNGAAFYVSNGASVTINGGTISNCTAGAGAINTDGSVTVNGGTFSACAGASGGAFYVYWNGDLTVNGGTFSNCTGSESGGIIKVWGKATVNGGVYENIPYLGFFQGQSSSILKIRGGVFDRKCTDSTYFYGATVEGMAIAFTGSDSTARYLLGTDVAFTGNKLATGTFAFDPSASIYADAGLAFAPYCVSTANGDGTYTVAPTKEPVPVSTWSDITDALASGLSLTLQVTADINQENDKSYLNDDQSVTIDLNGHKLFRHRNYWIFCLNSTGCELTLTDTSASGSGKITCESTRKDYSGCVHVNKGHLILERGTFTGMCNQGGGFAAVKSAEARVTMNGGTITDCVAETAGGAFFVGDGGVLTVNGGAILNCATYYTIFNYAGTVTLNGGVYNDGNLLKSGATLGDDWKFVSVGSTGLSVIGRDVTVVDNKIAAGTFAFDPRGEDAVRAGLGILSYASVVKNEADGTYTVAVIDPVVATTWESLRDGLAGGMNVTLAADIEATGAMCNLKEACAGKTLVLDLNGHTLTHASTTERLLTLCPEAAGCVLTITDSATNGFGRIVHTGGAVATNGACLFVDTETTAILKGGLIANFASTGEGGAVAVNEGDGVFTFRGGVISNCTATTGGAIANKGMAVLAGGVIDDETVTNAANNVTIASGCSFVGFGAGLHVIGRLPTFKNGYLVGGIFSFDPSLPLYSEAGLVLADFVQCVGLRNGMWAVNPGISLDSVVQNGSFERGTTMPFSDEASPVAQSGLLFWGGSAGASVYGDVWASTNSLSVGDGTYAALLAPGATITQRVAIVRTGSYKLSVGYAGEVGAVLSADLNGSKITAAVTDAAHWRVACVEFPVSYEQVTTLVISNASATARLAVDAITLAYAGESSSADGSTRISNGGFEIGTSLPATDDSRDLASSGVTDWTGSSGAEIFGAAADGWPCGVSEGGYALSLAGHASVTQLVQCVDEGLLRTVNGVTGRYYAVSYSYAARKAGDQPTLVSKIIKSDGTVGEISSDIPPLDGSWSSVSALVFLPLGTHAIVFVHDSNSGSVAVDNITLKPYVHPLGDLIFNGSFEYGAGLPDSAHSDSAKPLGAVEPSVWCMTNAAGVYGSSCISMSRAGTLSGAYGCFLKDGGHISQDFLVATAGTYRIAFSIAERLTAGGDGHPSVTVTLDGETVGSYTAYSSTRFDTQIAFRSLDVGSHTIAFEAKTALEQALLLDAVSIRYKPDVTPVLDVTGVAPSVRIVPSASTQSLLVKGAELTYSEIDTDTFTAEDFAEDATNDYFRLEEHVGVYAHPEYVLQSPLQFVNGCAISVGGLPRGGDGPILSFELNAEAVSDSSCVFAFESRDNGEKVALTCAPLKNGIRGEATNLFTCSVTSAVRTGCADLIVSWNDGQFDFYVNGRSAGKLPFDPDSTLLFNRLRLGAYPDSTETNVACERAAANFDLTDVRVYAQGLSAEQVVRLSDNVRGTQVDITLYDAATAKSYGTYERRVGALYGPLALQQAVREGMTFLGWKLASDGSGDYVSAGTVVTTCEAHKMYAQWSNNNYRVTYDFDGYPFAANAAQEIHAGEAYALPDGFEVNGATFNGWTNRYGQVVRPGDIFPKSGVYANETLYCSYENGYGPIVFEPHNGAAAVVVEGVKLGSPVLAAAPNDPARSGYAFRGWFSDETGGAQATEETLFGTVDGETWHAHWQGCEQTVTWRADGCTVPVQTTVSRSGEAYVLPDPVVSTNAQTDVKFYGWGRNVDGAVELIAKWDYSSGSWATNTAVTTWTNSHDAVALWWTACALDPNGGEVALEKTYLYAGEAYGAWTALPTPARTGYTFDGWATNVTDGAIVTDESIVELPVPTGLVARWAPLTVKVTLDANGGTSSAESVLVEYDGPYGEFPTPTRPGYALDSWHYILEDGAVITPETIVSNPEDHAVVASWTNAWYTMRYVVRDEAAGTERVVGEAFQQRYENPWQNLYVPTQDEIGENCVFEGWLLEETGEFLVEGDTAKMTESGNLIACISGEACTITLDAVDGVLDADYKTITLEFGEPVEGLPDAEGEEGPLVWRKNCEFVGWYTQSGILIENGMTWRFTGTTPLQARWRGTFAHEITYESNMKPYALVAAVHSVKYGYEMPIVTKPNRTDGATFLGWYDGDTPCTDAQGVPLAGYVTCPWEIDKTLVARWSMPRDAFAGAETLVSGVTNTVVGVDATDEPDEPNHDLEGVLRATHWYKFAGTAGQTVRIVFEDLTDLEPMVQLVIYSGTCLEDLEEVDAGSLFEMDNSEAVLEWTPARTETYYLALAQGSAEDNGCAALSAYSISATGVGASAWQSAWTDPTTMPGDTVEERIANALLNDGFDEVRANRLSSTATYAAFASWAGIGNEETEVPPELLNDKTNVVLAAAYNLTVKPSGTVAVTACASTNATDATALVVTVQVSGDFTAGVTANADLLAAALGVVGSTDLTGTYSADVFDYTTLATDTASNTVTLLVTPKKTEGERPTQFFIRGVSY